MKDLIKKMSLREKIGQTAIPSPPALRRGVKEEGGYIEYFKKYPFGGFYINDDDDRTPKDANTNLTCSSELAEIVQLTCDTLDIPLFVAVDAEFGGKDVFPDMSHIPTNMALGAANDPELAYKRSYYWAKELKNAGVNWAFGPVCDIMPSFFLGSTRYISDDTGKIKNLMPHMFRGIQDAGVMCCAKHYPGSIGDFRDQHFSLCIDHLTKKQWDDVLRPVWQVAADCKVDSFMTAHIAIPALDDTITRGKTLIPSSASPKTIGILRDEIGFDGIIVSDAVSMKAIAAAFDHDDMYIECFRAGNDIVLFTGNDYIDVIEKAVYDGRISEEQIDRSVERILNQKKKLGLFEGKAVGDSMTENDKKDFENTNYNISKVGAALLNNDGMIPFDKSKIKKATIIPLAPSEKFHASLAHMQEAFSKHGVESEIVPMIGSKSVLKEISENSDLIIYACYLAWGDPYGFPGFSQHREIMTLFNGLSYGAEKSVVASFGSPSVYYTYFETVNAYINMYSLNKESMYAFVDGIFGEFEFSGEPPVSLYPELV